MSLLKHIEENVEHLYALIKHVAATQEAAHGAITQETQALLEKIEDHLGLAKPAAPVIEGPVVAPVATVEAPVVVAAPVAPVVAPVVEAPQTVAQEQSAANVAN